MAAAESQDNSGGRGLWRLSGPSTFSGEAHFKFTPGTEVTKKQFQKSHASSSAQVLAKNSAKIHYKVSEFISVRLIRQ